MVFKLTGPASPWKVQAPSWTQKFDPHTQVAIQAALVAAKILEAKTILKESQFIALA